MYQLIILNKAKEISLQLYNNYKINRFRLSSINEKIKNHNYLKK